MDNVLDNVVGGNLSKTILSNYEAYEDAKMGSILRCVFPNIGAYDKKVTHIPIQLKHFYSNSL